MHRRPPPKPRTRSVDTMRTCQQRVKRRCRAAPLQAPSASRVARAARSAMAALCTRRHAASAPGTCSQPSNSVVHDRQAAWRSTRGAPMPAEACTHTHVAASTRHAPHECSRERVVLQLAWATYRLQATASTSTRAKPLPLPEACRHLREPSHMRSRLYRTAFLAPALAWAPGGAVELRRPDTAERAGRARWLSRMQTYPRPAARAGRSRGAALCVGVRLRRAQRELLGGSRSSFA